MSKIKLTARVNAIRLIVIDYQLNGELLYERILSRPVTWKAEWFP